MGMIVCGQSNLHPQTHPLPLKRPGVPPLGRHGQYQAQINRLCLMAGDSEIDKTIKMSLASLTLSSAMLTH